MYFCQTLIVAGLTLSLKSRAAPVDTVLSTLDTRSSLFGSTTMADLVSSVHTTSPLPTSTHTTSSVIATTTSTDTGTSITVTTAKTSISPDPVTSSTTSLDTTSSILSTTSTPITTSTPVTTSEEETTSAEPVVTVTPTVTVTRASSSAKVVATPTVVSTKPAVAIVTSKSVTVVTVAAPKSTTPAAVKVTSSAAAVTPTQSAQLAEANESSKAKPAAKKWWIGLVVTALILAAFFTFLWTIRYRNRLARQRAKPMSIGPYSFAGLGQSIRNTFYGPSKRSTMAFDPVHDYRRDTQVTQVEPFYTNAATFGVRQSMAPSMSGQSAWQHESFAEPQIYVSEAPAPEIPAVLRPQTEVFTVEPAWQNYDTYNAYNDPDRLGTLSMLPPMPGMPAMEVQRPMSGASAAPTVGMAGCGIIRHSDIRSTLQGGW